MLRILGTWLTRMLSYARAWLAQEAQGVHDYVVLGNFPGFCWGTEGVRVPGEHECLEEDAGVAVDGTTRCTNRVRRWTLTVCDDARDSDQQRGELAACSERQISVGTEWCGQGKGRAWDVVAIEGLDLVLCGGDAGTGDELLHAIDALERFVVPCRRRVRVIEIW